MRYEPMVFPDDLRESMIRQYGVDTWVRVGEFCGVSSGNGRPPTHRNPNGGDVMFRKSRSSDGPARRTAANGTGDSVHTAFARRRAARRCTTAVAVMLLAALAGACEDKDSTEPDADSLVGTWNATSLSAGGFDLIDQGMGLTATFTANGNVTLTITDDLGEFCDPGPNCVQTGTYTTTGNSITLETEGEDPLTFDFDVDGDDLTFTGDIGGTPVTMTFERA